MQKNKKGLQVILLKCPQCGAKKGKPCYTPKDRRKKTVHDLRPFELWI